MSTPVEENPDSRPSAGDRPPVGDSWRRRRERVFERDDYECQRCRHAGGEDGRADLQVHRLETPPAGGRTRLVTLCRECHAREHGLPSGSPGSPRWATDRAAPLPQKP